MPEASVDGTFLFYDLVGSGPPCLVMHGGLGIDHQAYTPGLDGLGARHLDRLDYLVIVCSSPTVDDRADVDARLERHLPVEPAGYGITPVYFHEFHPAFAAALEDGVIKSPEAARCSDLAGWERWDQLAAIDVPTLLIAGRHDWIPHLERLERAATMLPNADLVVFERSGHYPWLEEPAAFASTVVEWIRSTR
jgi:pimeloyl-ACP methyl ester carboxylesterase